MEERFFYCETCGNLLFATIASGITPYCCGDEMTLLTPHEEEMYGEKHIPVVEHLGNDMIKVRIGSELHPMTKEHGIRFICLETSDCVIIRYLDETEKPETTIRFTGEPKKVYAYCNKHGLWSKDIEM